MARGIQRRVEINDVKSIGAIDTYKCEKSRTQFADAYDARATSLPEGEIVADPTLRST